MASSSGGFGPPDRAAEGSSGGRGAAGVQISIPRTEEKSSMGGLKPYTAYCVEVSDFGNTYVVERRFDDFQTLRLSLETIDQSLPHLPEKKMWGSTDASVVAERRPAFEKLLNYMLRSEDIAFEPENTLWKFLDLPNPAILASRYLFRRKRSAYIKQMTKLLDDKYIEEHAYRLCHETIIAANLQLLTSEGQIVSTRKAASGSTEGVDGSPSSATVPVEAPEKSKGPQVNDPDLEAGVLDMLRHGLVKGTPSGRKRFLDDGGIRTALGLIVRMARREGAATRPDQKAKNVLSALVQADGEGFPATFASFLRNGGLSALSELRELCGKYAAYAEFLGKLLWLAWEVDTQSAFLQADPSGGEALALLGALFASGTKSGQIMAGLLLSSLVANDSFAHDRSHETKAAEGISGLLEDLMASMPSLTGPGQAGSSAPVDEDTQSAATFLVTVGRNERSFARLLVCAAAPCDMNTGTVFAHGSSARWSPCAFALWCLVKIRPKPSRVADFRPLLPALAGAGHPAVCWLTGELLLHLHSSGAEVGEDVSSGSSKLDGLSDSSAATTAIEQQIVEAAMSDQIQHILARLRDGLQENGGVMQQQLELVKSREAPLAGTGDGTWSTAVDRALGKLASIREKLTVNVALVQDRHVQSKETLESLITLLDAQGDSGSDADLNAALAAVQEFEGQYAHKQEEWSQYNQAYESQNEALENANNETEEADRKVGGMRKVIADLEQELSAKQSEANTQRTLASSDRAGAKDRIKGDIEKADQRLGALRDKAAKLQASQESGAIDPSKVPELMAQLKQEAQKCKQKKAELQEELQKVSADPEAIEAAARLAERQAVELQEQLATLRTSGLTDLERSHFASREVWREETTRLQEIRVRRDSAGRERDELKRQMDERWKRWNQLWSARLRNWRKRGTALGDAQASSAGFRCALSQTWDLLGEEQAARKAVLSEIASAQENLQRLAEQMVAVGDM